MAHIAVLINLSLPLAYGITAIQVLRQTRRAVPPGGGPLKLPPETMEKYGLTQRESEMANQILAGASNKEIARPGAGHSHSAERGSGKPPGIPGGLGAAGHSALRTGVCRCTGLDYPKITPRGGTPRSASHGDRIRCGRGDDPV